MDEPDIAQDPRYATFVARNANVDALEVLINDWAAQHDSDDILVKLHEADVPCEKVATIADVVTNPQVLHRRQIVDVPHAVAGSVPFQAPALKMWGTPTEIIRGAPGLGEHSGDILKEWLGYSNGDIDRLVEQGRI